MDDDWADLRLTVAMTTTGFVSSTVAIALAHLTCRLSSLGIRTDIAMSEIVDVASARRALVSAALEADATHILWLDGDIVVDAGDVLHLLGHRDLRVVSGLYRKRAIPYPPVVLDISDDGKFRAKYNFDPLGLTQIGGAGMGLVVVETDVYREMSKHFGDDHWYVFDPEMGEDLYFYKRLWEMGIPVWLDSVCRGGHETRRLITCENGWIPEAAVLDDGRR